MNLNSVMFFFSLLLPIFILVSRVKLFFQGDLNEKNNYFYKLRCEKYLKLIYICLLYDIYTELTHMKILNCYKYQFINLSIMDIWN